MKFIKRGYINLNKVYINKDNLCNNLLYFNSLYKGISVAPVIKSNAYSHGIDKIAEILDPLSCPFLVVDSLYEAYTLKNLGIKTPILILGYTDHENLKLKKLNFSFAVYDIDTLHVLNKYQKGVNVHIFIDTGMRREGIVLNDINKFIKEMNGCKNIHFEGLMSHLADSDNIDSKYNRMQIDNFIKAQTLFKNAGFNFKWRHVSATYGAINIDNTPFNLLRVGLGIYISPMKNLDKKIQNVLSLHSRIIQIKDLKKGEGVGYNMTYKAKKNIKIAIIPLGYFEGVPRRLSNCGFFMVKDVQCPIIGRVSMNLTTIDVSNVKNPMIGDDVTVFSEDNNLNSVRNVANIIHDIPYTILTNIQSSIKREII